MWTSARLARVIGGTLLVFVITVLTGCPSEDEREFSSETSVIYVLRIPTVIEPDPEGDVTWSNALEDAGDPGDPGSLNSEADVSSGVEVSSGGTPTYRRVQSSPVENPYFDTPPHEAWGVSFDGFTTECERELVQGEPNYIIFTFQTPGCEGDSGLIYRLPYADGIDVFVSRDDLSHLVGSGAADREFDLRGEPQGDDNHMIVAAAAGVVEELEDSNSGTSGSNNYVWISHQIGASDAEPPVPTGEWTKYTHIQTDSIPDDIVVGQTIAAGTVIGIEGDVGSSGGQHLHFEVAVPDDWNNAINANGFVISSQEALAPRICGISSTILMDGQTHTAEPCQ